MVKSMGNWRFWVYVAVIGLAMSITVRIIAETVQGESRNHEYIMGQIDSIDQRLTKLEASTHPATSKRYTSDDAARDRSEIYYKLEELKDELKKVTKRVCKTCP